MKSADPIHQVPSLDFGIWRSSSSIMSRAHAHPDVEVNFLQEGTVRYFVAGQFHDIRPGEVAVFWAGMPHQTLSKSPDASGIWLTLPLLWLLRWKNASVLADALLRGELICYKATPGQRELFEQWVSDFEAGDSALREIVACEIEAHFSRVSRSLKGKKSGGRKGFSDLRFEQITRYLAKHYTEEITVETIAAAVGLHPKYLLATFRRACQITLWEYVVRLRLAHAQSLLLTTDRTVVDIAFDAGFSSLSAFYHAFRKYVPGSNPALFRAMPSETGNRGD